MCPACRAWGEKPYRAPKAPLHPRYQTIALAQLWRHLLHYRRQHGLSQQQVAAQVGCTVRTIRDIEKRRTKQPKIWLRQALGTVLGVEIVPTTHH